ncbi:MAG: hypothetical protein MJY72_04850 [Bacteroidales bacterium]|nr:hypothetical protein [Bacteroidales bacterium]
MKKIFSILAAAIALVSLQSCQEKLPPEGYKAVVTTLDATDVSYESFTFNATIEYHFAGSNLGKGGVFYGFSEDINADNYNYSTPAGFLDLGLNVIEFKTQNYRMLMGVKTYDIEHGETVYYRAYARVFTDEGSKYIYGDVKSFVMP